MELEDRVGPASEECAGIIVQALAEDLPEDSRMSWRNHLIDASARLEPVTAAGLVVAAMEREKEATARSQLALALANVAPRLDPAEAARFCGRAARILAIGPAGEESANDRNVAIHALVELSTFLEPAEGAQRLATALDQLKDDHLARKSLVDGLAMISVRLDPARSAQLCGPAAQGLVNALARATDPGAMVNLEGELASLSEGLEPVQAARVRDQVTQYLAAGLARQTDAQTGTAVARFLSRVSARSAPADAARTCDQAASMLVAAMERDKDAADRVGLANGIQAVAGRLEAARAADICGQAGRLLIPILESIPPTDSFDGLYGPPLDGVSFIVNGMRPSESTALIVAAVERVQNNQIRHALVLSLVAAAS